MLLLAIFPRAARPDRDGNLTIVAWQGEPEASVLCAPDGSFAGLLDRNSPTPDRALLPARSGLAGREGPVAGGLRRQGGP